MSSTKPDIAAISRQSCNVAPLHDIAAIPRLPETLHMSSSASAASRCHFAMLALHAPMMALHLLRVRAGQEDYSAATHNHDPAPAAYKTARSRPACYWCRLQSCTSGEMHFNPCSLVIAILDRVYFTWPVTQTIHGRLSHLTAACVVTRQGCSCTVHTYDCLEVTVQDPQHCYLLRVGIETRSGCAAEQGSSACAVHQHSQQGTPPDEW